MDDTDPHFWRKFTKLFPAYLRRRRWEDQQLAKAVGKAIIQAQLEAQLGAPAAPTTAQPEAGYREIPAEDMMRLVKASRIPV